jgi:alpha-D-ribose 1-methylphosphonate 5-triphosphate diphosphatase
MIHDAQVAAAGITTVFDALAIGSRSSIGPRGRDQQTQCAESLLRFSTRQLHASAVAARVGDGSHARSATMA